MSGIVGGINLRSSGLVNNSSASDGQVFTGTGAGLPAGFEAAAGGGAWNYIATTTASNTALLEFKHGTGGVVIDSTYSIYVFMLKNIVPVSGSVELLMFYSTDAGSSYFTSGYQYTCWGYDASGSTRSQFSTSGSHMVIAYSVRTTSCSGQSGPVWLYDPSNSGHRCTSNWNLAYHTNVASAYSGFQSGCGIYDSDGDVDAVKFQFSSGNITTGEIRLYGISDS